MHLPLISLYWAEQTHFSLLLSVYHTLQYVYTTLETHWNRFSTAVFFLHWQAKLHTVHFTWYHKCKVEKNCFPGLTAYTLAKAGQYVVGLHLCKVRVLPHDQLVVYLRPQFLFCGGVFNSLGVQPALLHFTVVFEVLSEVSICPFLQTVKASLKSSSALPCIVCSFQLGIAGIHAEGQPYPLIKIANKCVK